MSISNRLFPKLAKPLAALATVAALCAAVGSAEAALVTGRFDPDFGGTLTGTGYEGTATFHVNDACLSLLPSSGAFIYSSYDCVNGPGGGGDAGMSFLGAHIDFYKTTDHSLLGSVDFAGDPLGGPSSVLGMYVENGQVVGVQTKVIGPATSTLLDGFSNPYSFLLLFGMENPFIGSDEDHVPGVDGDHDLDDQEKSVFQQTRLYRVTGESCKTSDTASCEQSAIASTVYVPEPGSAALALVALLAAAGLRRRAG